MFQRGMPTSQSQTGFCFPCTYCLTGQRYFLGETLGESKKPKQVHIKNIKNKFKFENNLIQLTLHFSCKIKFVKAVYCYCVKILLRIVCLLSLPSDSMTVIICW